MTTKTGYKEMLRDRVPFVVDLALKWCKSKTKMGRSRLFTLCQYI